MTSAEHWEPAAPVDAASEPAGPAGVTPEPGSDVAGTAPGSAGAAGRPGAAGTAALAVLSAGPLTTVQDLGRPGWAHLGVTRSGAADRAAFRLANRLVANVEHAPGLEVTLGGLRVRAADRPLLVAVTGADCPIILAGRPVPGRTLLTLGPGDVLELGRAGHGLRCYLAVRGGLDVPAQLGSSSTDLLSGLGPAPLTDGDVLRVRTAVPVEKGGLTSGFPVTDHAPDVHPSRSRLSSPGGQGEQGAPGSTGSPVSPGRAPGVPGDGPDVVLLTAVPGPRDGLLAPGALADLHQQTWQVAADSDRVGVRLQGEGLATREGAAQLPSEPVVRGAVQVPPGGEPVLFLADHPVTGGYPVVAVLTESSADRAAQLRPGDPVRIQLVPRPGWAD